MNEDPIEWEFKVPASQVDLKRIYDEISGQPAIASMAYLGELKQRAPTVHARYCAFLKDSPEGHHTPPRGTKCMRCGGDFGTGLKDPGAGLAPGWYHIMCTGFSFGPGGDHTDEPWDPPIPLEARLDAIEKQLTKIEMYVRPPLLLSPFSTGPVSFTPDPSVHSEPMAPAQRPAIFDILEERNRQLQKGYTAEHDDALPSSQALVIGAIAYLSADRSWPGELGGRGPDRRAPYREQVVKAAAMLVAEIERMDWWASKQ